MATFIIVIVGVLLLLCAVNWGYTLILHKKKKRFYVHLSLVTLWGKIGIIMFNILFFTAMFFKDFSMYLHPILWLSIKTAFCVIWILVAVNWLISLYYIKQSDKRIPNYH